jgi:hypothetical protein
LRNKPESPIDAIIFLDFHKTWKMKKTLLFFLLQLIWICLLIGGLFLYHNSITSTESHRTVITIKKGDPQNGNLELDPDPGGGRPVYVSRWRKVTWKIGPSSNVDSFCIEMKSKSEQIFLPVFRPHSKYTKSVWGTVNPAKKDSTIYDYTICWKMPGDTTNHRFDPKIAVNSTSFDFIQLLILIVYAVLAILTFGFFRKAKNSIGK